MKNIIKENRRKCEQRAKELTRSGRLLLLKEKQNEL